MLMLITELKNHLSSGSKLDVVTHWMLDLSLIANFSREMLGSLVLDGITLQYPKRT